MLHPNPKVKAPYGLNAEDFDQVMRNANIYYDIDDSGQDTIVVNCENLEFARGVIAALIYLKEQ